MPSTTISVVAWRTSATSAAAPETSTSVGLEQPAPTALKIAVSSAPGTAPSFQFSGVFQSPPVAGAPSAQQIGAA